jgi:hypothetical protein
MGQGLYRAGIDFPFVLMNHGVPVRVSLLLRSQEGGDLNQRASAIPGAVQSREQIQL